MPHQRPRRTTGERKVKKETGTDGRIRWDRHENIPCLRPLIEKVKREFSEKPSKRTQPKNKTENRSDNAAQSAQADDNAQKEKRRVLQNRQSAKESKWKSNRLLDVFGEHIQQSESVVDVLGERIQQLESAANDALGGTNAMIRSGSNGLEGRNAELRSDNNELSDRNARLRADNDELSDRNARLRSDNSELSDRNVKLRSEHDAFEALSANLPSTICKEQQNGLPAMRSSGESQPSFADLSPDDLSYFEKGANDIEESPTTVQVDGNAPPSSTMELPNSIEGVHAYM